MNLRCLRGFSDSHTRGGVSLFIDYRLSASPLLSQGITFSRSVQDICEPWWVRLAVSQPLQ